MNYYTYILYSTYHDQFYYGQTADIKLRLKKHNAGQVKSTKKYKPWLLFAYKELSSRSEAMIMERKLKNIKARKRLIPFILQHNFIFLSTIQDVIGPEF